MGDASGDAGGAVGHLERCTALVRGMPPREGSMRYRRSWTIEAALEQHQNLMRQHELQIEIGQNRIAVRRARLDFARLEAQDVAGVVRELRAASGQELPLSNEARLALRRAHEAVKKLQIAERVLRIEEASTKVAAMES